MCLFAFDSLIFAATHARRNHTVSCLAFLRTSVNVISPPYVSFSIVPRNNNGPRIVPSTEILLFAGFLLSQISLTKDFISPNLCEILGIYFVVRIACSVKSNAVRRSAMIVVSCSLPSRETAKDSFL